jgi:hypothetical protein
VFAQTPRQIGISQYHEPSSGSCSQQAYANAAVMYDVTVVVFGSLISSCVLNAFPRTERDAAMVTEERLIAESDLAEQLHDVMHAVRAHGVRYRIVRDGQTVAVLQPPAPPLGITVHELIDRVGDLEMPGDGFADDLEHIHSSQQALTLPRWP